METTTSVVVPVQRPAQTEPQTSVPFVIAMVGLLSALIATVVTHLLASRREKRQWERQVAQDDVRWKRERQERQEQWNREDEARWHQDRMAVYSTLLGSVERWIHLARHVKPFPLLGRVTLSRHDQDRLEALVEEIYAGEIKAELLAPEALMAKIRGLYIVTSFFSIDMSEVRGRTPEELEKQGGELIDKVINQKRAVQDHIKRSLKIETEGEPSSHEAKPKAEL
ncbi:hypothetical protein [Micromonospora sp. DH14]|uniref:hypothetical protein n=1 Tax=Micromonospora sp. DH14 TaxID=3040120 RepID=UPI002441626E|nr:hypothetical protein [Micromonospora sp. DH14]MDG9674970.1 hypothetical protein [Micromonospora sp. DH14]